MAINNSDSFDADYLNFVQTISESAGITTNGEFYEYMKNNVLRNSSLQKEAISNTSDTEKESGDMSSRFPVYVSEMEFKHKSGTKRYSVSLFSTASGQSIVMMRFGKVGNYGQVRIVTYDLSVEAESFYNKKLKERERKGYEAVDDKSTDHDDDYEIGDIGAFKDYIGLKDWNALGRTNQDFLFSNLRLDDDKPLSEDEIKAKEAKSQEIRDKRVEVERLKKEKAEKAEEAAKRKAEKELAEYRKNPVYGSF